MVTAAGGRATIISGGEQLIAIIFGRAAQFLLALAMMRVATTLLSPEEMGSVSLVLSTIAFFALFLVSPVGTFINRRLHSWQASGDARHYLVRYVNYLLLVSLMAAAALPLFYMLRLVDFGIPVDWLIVLVCGSLLFNTINQTTISSLNLLGHSKMFVLLSVATVASSFACATLLVHFVETSAKYWLLGLLLGQFSLGLVGTRILFARLHPEPLHHATPTIRKRYLLGLYRFAWPVAIASGLAWTQGQGYRYLMEGQLGLAQLGLFVAGYGISAGMLAGFEAVLTTYFQPRLFRDVSKADPARQAQAWQRYAAAMIPSLLLTVAFIAMLAPELTRILLGENFQSAVEFVIWGALAEAARILTGIYSLIAHVYMQTRWLILPNLIGAVLSITLCMLLMPAFGAIGVGIGLVLSGSAVVVTMHILLGRRVDGAVSIRPVLMAFVFASLLWGVTLILRQTLDATGWELIAGVLVLVSIIYLGLQYIFLRGHLEDYQERS